MTSIHSQLVGGVVVKAIKGNENSKHLAKMSALGKTGPFARKGEDENGPM